MAANRRSSTGNERYLSRGMAESNGGVQNGRPILPRSLKYVGLIVKMGVSCAAFIDWKHRAQARVTRAYYRQLALPSGTGREMPRPERDDRAHRFFREKRAPAKRERKKYITGIIWVRAFGGRQPISGRKANYHTRCRFSIFVLMVSIIKKMIIKKMEAELVAPPVQGRFPATATARALSPPSVRGVGSKQQ